jgi:aryl-alcohol dehydrogenase-like predicted oxidoreductase
LLGIVMMRYLRLGETELTRIGLGTNRLIDTRENRAFLRAAVDAGINFIDTAHLYTDGDSERTIGNTLTEFRDGVVIATKGGYRDGSAEGLRSEIEDSLRRLQCDTIDLYYLHRVDPQTPIETSLGAIKEYQDRGRIRDIGISAVGLEQIERAREVVTVAAVQNHYNIAERDHEQVVDYCEREQILFVPYYPLRDVRGSTLREVAATHGATPEQVALAWLLRRSPVMIPIPGTLSIEHLRENMAALEVELTDEEFQAVG